MVEPHDADLAFRFVSGRPFLDLAATLGKRFSERIERLRTPGDLSRWLVATGLWERAGAVSSSDLTVARRLREAIFGCVLAAGDGRALPRRDLAIVNASARRAIRSPRLLPSGAVSWSSPTVRHALAEVARDAARTLGGDLRSRVRKCGRPECSIFFLDDSRTGQRRWCSMASCGNRMKVARFRQRST